MRVALPVAAYHRGNPAEFCQRALESMGHTAKVLSQYEFYDAFKAKEYDLYFCVDSGGPLNLFESSIVDLPMNNVAFYMIDYRRGKHLKNPNDIDTCRQIGEHGGWIFQAQEQDVVDCSTEATTRVSWLPLAVDEEIWSDKPEEEKIYDVGMIGNIWDGARQTALDMIRTSGLKLSPTGGGNIWGEDAAKLLRQSKVVFNISSFYGESVAFDWNMRGPESLSVGRPFVTNYIPSLEKLGLMNQPFLKVYRQFNTILPAIYSALGDSSFMQSGPLGREWVMRNATYKIRMQQALDILKEKGVV